MLRTMQTHTPIPRRAPRRRARRFGNSGPSQVRDGTNKRTLATQSAREPMPRSRYGMRSNDSHASSSGLRTEMQWYEAAVDDEHRVTERHPQQQPPNRRLRSWGVVDFVGAAGLRPPDVGLRWGCRLSAWAARTESCGNGFSRAHLITQGNNPAPGQASGNQNIEAAPRRLNAYSSAVRREFVHAIPLA